MLGVTIVVRAVVALAALAAILVGAWRLEGATDGLLVQHGRAGAVPITTFAPQAGGPAPVVVIAHGFAGSQQLMLPFAVTLARNGYLAVTFDFPGHGRNPEPLRGGLADNDARNDVLTAALGDVVAYARALPRSDGSVALLGHSMASDIVVRYAQAHPEIAATVAVSPFSPGVTPSSPRNLLVIIGALEPAMLIDEGRRVVGQAALGPAEERTTYGSFADGTARRLTLSGGVEHIGVLYSRQSMAEALDWMNQVFGRSGSGFLDGRAPWLGLLYLGLLALGWPLAGLLPRVASAPLARDRSGWNHPERESLAQRTLDPDLPDHSQGDASLGAGLRWRQLLPVAVLPALLTPLILWKLPTDFLPILLGDYLASHYAIYGALTGLGLWLTRRPRPMAHVSGWAFVAAAAALAGYCILAIGLPLDRYVTSFLLPPGRVPVMLAVLAGTLPFAVADEWLTRGAAAARGGYAFTKLCFLVSLALAIALNPPRLFFLIIILPVILVFLVVYGLFSTWAYRRTRHPLVGALATALAFAWAIAAVFPLVG